MNTMTKTIVATVIGTLVAIYLAKKLGLDGQ